MRGLIVTTGLMLLATIAAHAQQAPAHTQHACAATDAGLKDGLEAWRSKATFVAAGTTAELAGAELKAGTAVRATLLRTPKVVYPVQPEKPGGSVSYGGLFLLKVVQPGTYRIALSTPAWIDVVKDGKAIPSTTFGHGPECSTIRKIVEFPLSAGPHIIAIAANGSDTVDLMLVLKD